ncbi:MAG: hypothetical protein JNK05_28090 [Myxococcales bacterium]|nr:hypothetical protein [Myxococcales bacterium]
MTYSKLACLLLVGVSANACMFHNRPFERMASTVTRSSGVVLPPAASTLMGAPLRPHRASVGGSALVQPVFRNATTRDRGANGNLVPNVAGGGGFSVRLPTLPTEVGLSFDLASSRAARETYADVEATSPLPALTSGRVALHSRSSWGDRVGAAVSASLGVVAVDYFARSDVTITTRYLDNNQVVVNRGGYDQRFAVLSFEGSVGANVVLRPVDWFAFSAGGALAISPYVVGYGRIDLQCSGANGLDEFVCAIVDGVITALGRAFTPKTQYAVTLTPWVSFDFTASWLTLSAQVFANAPSSADFTTTVPFGARLGLQFEFDYTPTRAAGAAPTRPTLTPAVNASPDEPQARGARTL